ncbi:MAG: nuclear transport factor 2 family protein [Sphingomonas sp.]
MRLSHILLASPLLLLAVPASAAPGDEAKLKAIEVAWGKALIKGDTKALKSFTAPEWTLQSSAPKPATRAESINDVATGKQKMASYSVRDMRVKVIGDIAIVMGYDDEKSSYDGKDTSGTYSFTDVFQRRGGKWVAIATQVGKVGS